MSTRSALWISAGLLFLSGCARPVEKPDIVFIIVDTLRGDHVGYASDGSVSTPNIDALAADGHRFENAFAHSAITGPSHAAMFTGRRPSETGVLNNAKQPLPGNLMTLPRLLTANGYTCDAVVSLGPIRGRLGFADGFASYDDDLGPGYLRPTRWTLEGIVERFSAPTDTLPPRFDFIHIADPHEPYDALGSVVHEAELSWNGKLLKTIDTSTYDPLLIPVELEAGTSELVLRGEHPFRLRRCSLVRLRGSEAEQLDEPSSHDYRSEWRVRVRVDKPGTGELAIALDDLDGSDEEIQRRYRLEVENTDRYVGQYLDALRAAGRYDESLIIFSSDHGEALGYLKGVGHVNELYDRYVQVPLIIKPPRSWRWKTGVARDELVVHADYLPTLCDLLGLPAPESVTGKAIYGDSIPEDRMILLETHAPQAPVTKYGVRSRRHKLIWTPDREEWEFFDLVGDPNEQTNLFDERREEAEPYVKWLLSERDIMNERAALLGAEPVEVDEDAEEVLRALGYVN